MLLNGALVFVVGIRCDFHYKRFLFPKKYVAAQDAVYIKTKEARTKLLASLKIAPTDIVFLGNSLTENFELQEMFGTLSVKNRGVSGNTAEDILERLSTITIQKPRKIVLMCGINDLYREAHTEAATYKVFKKIIEKIKEDSPTTQILVESTLPVAENPEVNRKIINYNRMLVQFCKTQDIAYIDLYQSFAHNGAMREELTTDGVHLTEKGYILWKNLLATRL